MPYKLPAYPATLTDAAWQKKKGAIAKIAGKTGVGDALKAAEKSFKAIDVKKLDITTMLPTSGQTKPMIDAAFKDTLTYYNQAIEGDLRKKLQAVIKVAGDTATKWEKNKLIPKASAKYARDVEKAADFLMVSMNKNTVHPKLHAEYQISLDVFDKHNKVIEENSDRLRKYLKAVAKGLGSIKTAKDFKGSFWSEDIRGVGTALPLVSKDLGILNEHKIWRKFASQDFLPQTDDEVPEKIKQMAPVLKKIAAAVK